MAVSKKAPAKKTTAKKPVKKASKATTKKNATKKSTAKAGKKTVKKPERNKKGSPYWRVFSYILFHFQIYNTIPSEHIH